MNDVGFYGKLACRGDFVSRGLPQSFIQPWDQWLAAGIQASQQALGEGWLQAYLVSPLWRFALAPGVCGPDAVVGVLMPSIDRVGRYFPLSVAQLLEPGVALASIVGGADEWFEGVEAALLGTLEAEATFEHFAAALQPYRDARPLLQGPRLTVGGLQLLDGTTAQGRALALAECACDGMSLWWGQGSERIAPGLLRSQGLPRSEQFAAFLLGSEVRPA
ncbi:type VI secretion system-associated protein TagF [Pseudomonas sp. AFG_SD02_1510_Pfu_092]|uniref:type VI secretion system-associated protein TagF n=1 Tax=Pseudomonas sp. AFG_SD02_1510_Pfu_092 TaxID=2259497 RepID=UPI000DEFD70E|nr:type VI secretion system-associated protein TagF [Pseudomonas sp. AFG_SD02_1510_Pfu_092]RCL24146.1 type VI secretion system-associated protein TagF [Pseudomonas sp. AFG_SD02_1510_Pfu_092]